MTTESSVADVDVAIEASSNSNNPAGGVRSDPFLIRAFLAHAAQYVGIAMVSGSVVHASILGGSLIRHGATIAAGTLVYSMKFLIEAGFRIDRRLARFLAISTFVALGTGMLSGSVQHFLDGPHAGAVLASVGVVVAYVSFCLREDRRALTWRSMIVVLLVGGVLFGLLWSLAGMVSGSGGAHH